MGQLDVTNLVADTAAKYQDQDAHEMLISILEDILIDLEVEFRTQYGTDNAGFRKALHVAKDVL